ncbi:MAG TPA: DUF1501 domain-containing protein [Gemmataceae bacterium]|nr:DUF1501 domain-containing protein [Gemmataceae bacterium]
MLSVFDKGPGHSRREFLRIGSLGLGGLCLPQVLGDRALAAGEQSISTGKSVIFLFQFGGPSQFETFDPKMTAPDGVRSVTGEISTTLPGVTFGSSFPQLARRAGKLAVVRSYVPGREISNHLIYPIVHPTETLGASLGSLYSRMAGMTHPVNGLPTNAALFPNSVDERCPPTRMDFGNFLATGNVGTAFAPFVPGGNSTLLHNLQLNMPRDRLDERRRLQAQFDGINRQLDGLDGADALDRLQAQAIDVIVRGAADAFDLSRESARVIARYDTAPLVRPESVDRRWRESYPLYLEHGKTLGKLLLLARRLCERGCGFVMINTGFVWDMHGVDGVHAGVEEGMRYVAPPLDHAVSAFLDDVEARGLSDRILLVMCGEMGRTPRISQLGGRDHWGNLGPLVLAGGGLRMGQVIGRSTANGGEPADSPVQRRNLISTIWHTLFDIGALRVRPDAPGPVAKLMTDNEPIGQLIA